MSRRLIIALLALAGIAAGSTVSFGYMTAGTSTGSAGRALAGGMSAPGSVTATASGADVTVTWSAATLDGSPVTSYTVKRGATTICSSVTDASRTCTDSNLVDGAYTYTVTAAYKGWTTSGTSNTVTIALDNTPPAFQSITRVSSSPSNGSSISWTVTFTEAVTGVGTGDFSLFQTTSGAALTSVSGSGATYTVTASTGSGDGLIRLNLTDDDTIVDAAGNRLGGTGTGTIYTGEAYTIDKTVPTVTSISRTSVFSNGSSVTWPVVFSEAVSGVDATDFSLQASGPSGAVITSVTGSGTNWSVTASTGTGDGSISLNLVDDDTILDTAGNKLGGTGTGNGNFSGAGYAIDKTKPTRTGLRFLDVDTDGRVDQVEATFSENVSAGNTAQWVLTNVPSHPAGTVGATSATVPSFGSTVTVLFPEGAGAQSTAVGSFTVALNASSTGVQDQAGNQASFTAATPTDLAAPIPTAITDTNVALGTAGRFDTGDTVTVTFTEPVTGLPATTTVTLANGATNDTMAAPSFLGASTSLGSGNYMFGSGTATFSASPLTQPTGSQVTLTLGTCGGTCVTTGNPRLDTGTGTFVYAPSTVIKDAANNAATGSVSFTGGLF